MTDRRNLTAQPPRRKRQTPIHRGKRQQLTINVDWRRRPGQQALHRVYERDKLGKILKTTQKRKRNSAGFRKEASGDAAVILRLLRDPRKREELLAVAAVKPEFWKDDEHCARALAVGLTFNRLARVINAMASQMLDEFERQRRMERTLRELGPDDYTEDADWHAKKATRYLHDLLPVVIIRSSARFLGWSLDWNFGLRAPRLVAGVVTCIFELKPPLTEGQARYLCGWKNVPPAKRRAQKPPRLGHNPN